MSNLDQLLEQKKNQEDQIAQASTEQEKRMLEEDLERTNRQIEEAQSAQIEEKVQAIALPHDFNEVFDDPRANDMIIELIQIFQRQAYVDHAADLAKLNDEWRENFRAQEERETKLQQQYEELQRDYDVCVEKNIVDAGVIMSLTAERDEARKNRDNAAIQLDEANNEIKRLNDHIADLRLELSNAPAPKSAIEIGPSDRLSQLVQETKEAKAAKALDAWNARNPGLSIPSLEVPQFRDTEPSSDQLRDGDTETASNIPDAPLSQFQTESELGAEPGTLDEMAESDDRGVVSREEFEALKADVEVLKGQVGRWAA